MPLSDDAWRAARPFPQPAAGSRILRAASAPAARRLGALVLILGIALAAALVGSLIARAAENPPVNAPAGVSSAGRTNTSPLGNLQRLARKLSTMRKLGFRGSKNRLFKKAQDCLDIIQACWFDFKHGTDTARWAELADLDIRSENRQRGVGYAATPARPFKKIMNTLNFPSGSVFVDLGSGKGKTLMMASEYGFKRVVGVEFSPELCEIAKRNWSIYRNGVETGPDFEIVNSDVVDYEIKDDENVFFMFNPFDAVVMSKVIQNLGASLKKQPRRIWIIYHNPVWHDIIEGQDTFLGIARIAQRAGSFAVYMR